MGIAFRREASHSTFFSYDGFNRLLSTQWPSVGTSSPSVETYIYNAKAKTNRTAPGGKETVYFYDERERLCDVVYEPDSSTSTALYYVYDAVGNVLSVEGGCYSGALAGVGDVAYTYDALNRAALTTGPNDADSQPLYRYTNEYDIYGNLARLSETYPSSSAHLNARVMRMAYDAADRLTSEIQENLDDKTFHAYESQYGYDAANNRTARTHLCEKVSRTTCW